MLALMLNSMVLRAPVQPSRWQLRHQIFHMDPQIEEHIKACHPSQVSSLNDQNQFVQLNFQKSTGHT